MRQSRFVTAALVCALAGATTAPARLAAAQPAAGEARSAKQTVEAHRNPWRGIGDAFRTAGRGVVYGTRTTGRAISGRRNTPEGRMHEAHDRARMEQRARETRRDFRGH